MFASVSCQKIDERKCLLIGVCEKNRIELEFKIPYFKTKKKIWTMVHRARTQFHKNGIYVTGSQISATISSIYLEIPFVYY